MLLINKTMSREEKYGISLDLDPGEQLWRIAPKRSHLFGEEELDMKKSKR